MAGYEDFKIDASSITAEKGGAEPASYGIEKIKDGSAFRSPVTISGKTLETEQYKAEPITISAHTDTLGKFDKAYIDSIAVGDGEPRKLSEPLKVEVEPKGIGFTLTPESIKLVEELGARGTVKSKVEGNFFKQNVNLEEAHSAKEPEKTSSLEPNIKTAMMQVDEMKRSYNAGFKSEYSGSIPQAAKPQTRGIA